MKGIRFKKDCYEWIKQGTKTTTFRKTKRNGVYEIVEGGWFKAKPYWYMGKNILLLMKPIKMCNAHEIINVHYHTEGPFNNKEEFIAWLEKVKLELPEFGWLNSLEVVERKNNES